MYRLAQEIHRRQGDGDRQASVVAAIGHIYQEQAQFDSALAAFQTALCLYQQHSSHPVEIAMQFDHIGNTYFERGELDKALKAFGDALHVFKLLGHRHGEAQSLGNIGLLHRRRGAEVEALDYLAQARAIYRDTGDRGGRRLSGRWRRWLSRGHIAWEQKS